MRQTNGTHSILDVVMVVPAGDTEQLPGTIKPFAPDETRQVFGSTQPCRADYDRLADALIFDKIGLPERGKEVGMTWHGSDIIMATAFTALLVNCGAFLAFGRHFPGTFHRPGARQRAWIGVCLGIALDIVTLINVIAPKDSDFSGAKGNWITVFLVLSCTLVLTAIMLVVLLVRASVRARHGRSWPWQDDGSQSGRHAASHEPGFRDPPGPGA